MRFINLSMATPEFGHNLFDEEQILKSLEFDLLVKIKDSYNYEANQFDSNLEHLDWKLDQKINYHTPVPDDKLTIEVHDKIREIGYFSPVTNEYHIYNSFIDAQELPQFQMLAGLKRKKALESFDSRKQDSKRFDFTHPAVRQIHQEHHEVLIESGLAAAIAMDYNAHPGIYSQNYFDVDRESHASVYLRPGAMQSGGVEPYYYIGLAIWGGFKHKKRIAYNRIEFAKLEEPIGPQSPYVAYNVGREEPIIKDENLNDLINLIPKINLLHDNIENFSTEKMGVLKKPGDPAPLNWTDRIDLSEF
jgi:hypothetical protein